MARNMPLFIFNDVLNRHRLFLMTRYVSAFNKDPFMHFFIGSSYAKLFLDGFSKRDKSLLISFDLIQKSIERVSFILKHKVLDNLFCDLVRIF